AQCSCGCSGARRRASPSSRRPAPLPGPRKVTAKETTMAIDPLRDLLTRRTAGKVLLGGATCGYAGAIGYPVVRYLASGAEVADEGAQVNEVALGKPEEVFAGAAGGEVGKNFAFGSKPALLIRNAQGEYFAYEATCSHLGCTVAFNPAAGKIQ